MAIYYEQKSLISFVKENTPTINGETTLECVERAIKNAPTADVVAVVRCKDCKHWRHETDGMIDHYECNVFCGCYGRGYLTGADDFCSYGERKE